MDRAGASQQLCRLLERCHEQDEGAWAEFHPRFHRLAAQVLARFSNLTPLEREEAEDAARVAVALEINKGQMKATTDGAAIGFMRAVLTNAARDVWRRRRPSDPLPSTVAADAPSPWDETQSRVQLEGVERAIQSWSAENRFVFMMKLQEVSAATIKADLERLFGLFITTEAVDVRYFRLRQELRRRCGDATRDA